MDKNRLARQFNTVSLLLFALPNIAMMVFLSMYTIVDGMFISHYVGTLALSAMNMSYPLTSLQLAIGIMLGTGGSAVIARQMGEGKERIARENFTCVVVISILIGMICAVLGNVYLDPILRLLGTSPAQFEICRDYTRILLWFSPALFLQTLFQILFVTAGKPGLGLGLTIFGGIANVVLDALFMGPMEMGMSGAAIATVIGYLIPAVAGVFYFAISRNKSLYFTRFSIRRRTLLQICSNGSSEMVSNIANAVTTFLFNIIFISYWGEDGVASISIVMYFQFVFSAMYLGFSMGVAPVISYKYGAQDLAQLKHLFRICMGFILFCSLGAYLLSQVSIQGALRLFTEPGGMVYHITIDGFPLYAISFLFMGVSIFASSLFTAFSDGLVSALISFARTFIFLVAMLVILPWLLDETGIWLAVPAAELMGLVVSVGCLIWGRRKYQY